MADLFSVRFAFKTHSAKSLDELVEKTRTDDVQTLINTSLGFYSQIAHAFEQGHDIIETDDFCDTPALVDLFSEIAEATKIEEITLSIDPNLAQSLQREFSTKNISHIFTNALYFFDRMIDLKKSERYLAANNTETNRATIFKMTW